jgi:co-chaperonin GroES (HSP10)
MRSMIEIPDVADYPPEMRPTDAWQVTAVFPEIAEQDIPEVALWRVLVVPSVVPDKFGEIALVADTVRHMEVTRTIGKVLAVGPMAYAESRGFRDGVPEGARVKPGDIVIFHANAGQDVPANASSGGMVTLKFINESDVLARLTPEQAQTYMVIK